MKIYGPRATCIQTDEDLSFILNEDRKFQKDKVCNLYKVSVQFISVAQQCLTLCNPMDCNMPGFPVHYQLLEFAQTHVH